MPVPSDLVHQTTTGTSTGNLTLAVVNGKRSFSVAFGTGAPTNVFDYYISHRTAAEWERGTGHMSDATTLVRDTVIASSNANSAVNFSAGTKDVTNDIPAAKQVDTDSNQTLTGKTISGADNTLTVREADLSIADNTTGNVSASAHGFAPKLPNNTTTFLRGDGSYATPPDTVGQPIPTSSAWDIGTLQLFLNTGSTVTDGNTTAGSNLKLWVGAPEALSGGTAWANASASLNSSGRTAPSGTWKNVTGASVDNSNTYTAVGYFVRTA